MTGQVKERPLIACAESVLAYKEHRKAQMRRVIRPQPIQEVTHSGWYSWKGQNGWRPQDLAAHCPYGVPGDHLYARETFGYVWPEWCDNGIVESGGIPMRAITNEECDIVYRATDPDYLWADDEGEECTMWKPIIFMPKSRARIWLEVTAPPQAQRLHDMTAADAVAEGVYRARDGLWTWDGELMHPDPVSAYAYSWNLLNEKRGYPWRDNWWVWVVTTRTIQGGDK